MVRIGKYLVDPERILLVEDTHNRTARPGVWLHVRGMDDRLWVERLTMQQVEMILERAAANAI